MTDTGSSVTLTDRLGLSVQFPCVVALCDLVCCGGVTVVVAV